MTRKRQNILIGGLFLLLLAVIPISLCLGRFPISPTEIRLIFTGGQVAPLTRDVFFTLRLPRTILAVIAGVGLSLAGFVYQNLFKNLLASPDIIGVSSGANAGVAVGTVLLGGGSILISVCAFVGGTLATLLAMALAGASRRRSLASIVLSGIVIRALADALIMVLKMFADPERELAPLEFWSMGGLGAVTDKVLLSVLPGFLLGLVLLILLRYQITLLGLPDEEARALGVRVSLMRTLVILAATVMVASVVSATGLISFVGLIAPHAARLITRRSDARTALISALLGAIVLVAADCVARSVSSSEIPISILTSLIGAPFLVSLMLKRRGSTFY